MLLRLVTIIVLLQGCATTEGPDYRERCPSTEWTYRFNVERSSLDAHMESSGRRACLRFQGPDSCLVHMEKVTEEDYRATCGALQSYMLKGTK
jgi:hypothetical protein